MMKKDNIKLNENLIGLGIVVLWFSLMFVIAKNVM